MSVGELRYYKGATNAGPSYHPDRISRRWLIKLRSVNMLQRLRKLKGYMLQINVALASGDTKDKEKATMMFFGRPQDS